jgi:hypothetical protein
VAECDVFDVDEYLVAALAVPDLAARVAEFADDESGRDSDDQCDSRDRGRLPGNGGAYSSTGEADRLEHRELTASLSYRDDQRVAHRDGADEFVESSRYYAGMLALSAIFERTGLDCEFRLFMYDDITKLLMPAFVEEPESTARGWEPGKGATGVAFSENRYVIATGDETHDETYGLSHEQQQKYKKRSARRVTKSA